MKAHFGVDSRSKLIHAVVTTPANAADSTVLPDLSHGKATRVWGIRLTTANGQPIRQRAAKVQDFVNSPTATAASSIKSNGRKTAPNPECGLGSNMQSG